VKLYYFPIAPNPTKVRVYIAEKGVELELAQVDLAKGEQRSVEHLARNPHGALPVLELDDGSFLCESLAIIEYLEELYPRPVLIGSTPESRARVRSIERMIDIGVLMAGGRAVHATNSPLGLAPNPAVAESALVALHKSVAHVDAVLAESAFAAGDHVTIADCTLWAALQFIEFFGIDAIGEHRNLADWKQRFARRPSIQTGISTISNPLI